MDPVSAIGLAASAAQLAGLAKDIVANMWRYFEAVKDAPKNAEQLRQEVGHLSTLLDRFDDKSLESLFTDKTPLEEFLEILKELRDRVAPRETKGSRRLKWPFTQDQNKRLLDRIERYKANFNLALNLKVE